jgi:hypothetical protein
MKPTPEIWTLTFRPESDPNGNPPEIRIRRLLKIALRSMALRCIDIRHGNPDAANAGNRSAIEPTSASAQATMRQNASQSQ